MMGRTVAQMDAEWIAHGNIARLKYTLEHEANEARRTWLEGLLKEQRTTLAALVEVED